MRLRGSKSKFIAYQVPGDTEKEKDNVVVYEGELFK